MKRTRIIHFFISLVLGMAVGSFISLAITCSEFVYGVFAIIATVGCVLNIACGPDTSEKKKDAEN